MKKVIKLTESDLNRIVRKVINEGAFVTERLAAFPDGTYSMTAIKPTNQPSAKGTFLIKDDEGIKIVVDGQVIMGQDGKTGLYGSGSLYTG